MCRLQIKTPIRCLHLADLHIGYESRELGSIAQQRMRERDSLLRKAADFALDDRNKVDVVLIAGDLFETHTPSASTVEEVMRELRRLEEQGILVVICPGNHDEITYTDSVYRVYESRVPGVLVRCPMPEHVCTRLIRGVPLHIYGMAYTGGITRTLPALSEFPRLDEPGIHVALFHGSLGASSGDRSVPLDKAGLACARYDYVALGHFHRFIEEDLPYPGGVSKAVYPGLIETRGFFDEGHGMLTVVDILPAHARITKTSVDTRVYRTVEIDLTIIADAEQFARRLRQVAADVGSGAIIRLRLLGHPQFTINPEDVQAEFACFFHHLEVAAETTNFVPHDIELWSREPTIRGEFIRAIEKMKSETTDEHNATLLQLALLYGLQAMQGGERR